ncbi:hypothetical protein KVG96_01165 [Pseudomonas sp. COR58]|uniref:YD repeat-containing protein n=1 Tax=Pseudomonas ekonensis TaxID=2842353 RepID=A0ABS6P7X4_9PSED|nr:hypothetical protein [Pseudomonas ekonensis]MBV4456563.1 hypothetical protein [Pseudomonas ekonensis]
MSTNQEKSFIATLSTPIGNPHFPRLTYGRNISTLRPDYEAFTFSSHIDVSDYLFLHPGIAPDALTFYFRCYDNYYAIYILNRGPYYYRAISKEQKDFLNAYVSQDGDETTFNLLDANGKIITLDQLDSDTPTVRIQTRAGKLLRAGLSRSKYDPKVGTFIRTDPNHSSTALDFRLNILQRNAPY